MDAIRPTPASTAHGAQSARHRAGTEDLQAAGPFFALLAGMDAQAGEPTTDLQTTNANALDDSWAGPGDALAGINLLLAASDPAARFNVTPQAEPLGGKQLSSKPPKKALAAEMDNMATGSGAAAQRVPGGVSAITEPVSGTVVATAMSQPMETSTSQDLLPAFAAHGSGIFSAQPATPMLERNRDLPSAAARSQAKPLAMSGGESLENSADEPLTFLASSSLNALSQAAELGEAPPRSFAAPSQGRGTAATLPASGGVPGARGNSVVVMASQLAAVANPSGQAPVDAAGRFVAGGGLVAQTARIDASSVRAGENIEAVSAGATPAARRSSFSASAGRLKTVFQAPDVSTRSVIAATAASAINTTKEVRGASEGKLLAVDARRAEGGAPSVKDFTFTDSSPQPVPMGFVAPEVPRERTQLANGRQEFGGPVTTGSLNVDHGVAPALDASGGTAEGAAPTPEEALAEQVTYWLSDNLKNAELTVEHAGHPVEVRVSLAGNEAHVAFRSDMAQTRELLDARMEQLRELLQEQGLVLSGTTVDAGSSGRSDSSGDQRAPENARAASVLPSTESLPRRSQQILTKTSVDLYV